mgnify:CR=1 FL=1
MFSREQYKLQFGLSTGIVDAALFLGGKVIPIDAKFPHENYERLVVSEDEFSINEIATTQAPRNDISIRLFEILNAAKKLNTDFLSTNGGFNITTKLNFPENWGLGSSSTLINNIANWANVNPYDLLELTFGGSGYDIACAQNNNPITYEINQVDNIRVINSVDFSPSFKEALFFVHLNKKQNSRDGIASYKLNKGNINFAFSEINDITNKIIEASTLSNFESLITRHETIISKIIKIKPIANGILVVPTDKVLNCSVTNGVK